MHCYSVLFAIDSGEFVVLDSAIALLHDDIAIDIDKILRGAPYALLGIETGFCIGGSVLAIFLASGRVYKRTAAVSIKLGELLCA